YVWSLIQVKLHLTVSSFIYLFHSFQNNRSQRSTLFPYTTLFRSILGSVAASTGSLITTLKSTGYLLCAYLPPFCWQPCCPSPPADRKSTRLNSSHVKNSYAVFCLKKKNIHIIYNNTL